MRFGLIAPPWVPDPPNTYGGTEVVIDDNVARGLQDVRHHVQLLTIGESTGRVSSEFRYPAAVAPIGGSVEQAAAHVSSDHRRIVEAIAEQASIAAISRHPTGLERAGIAPSPAPQRT
jgi:hypothetical protein